MQTSLRPETDEDEPFLHQLIVSSLAGELAAWAFPEAIRAPLLETQYRARVEGIRAAYPHAERGILLVDGQPAGRVVIDRSAEEIYLVDIVVLPTLRNRGVGSAVLRQLIEESEKTRRPLSLNVDAVNPAQRLYQRLGFLRVGGDEVQLRMSRPVT